MSGMLLRMDKHDFEAGVGVLCALPQELGSLVAPDWRRIEVQGIRMAQGEIAGCPVWASCVGVGKVAAAHGAALLLAQGVGQLMVVGTCGGLQAALQPGNMVHCEVAIQADLALREGRLSRADPALLERWRSAAPGPLATFLSADRPVLNPWHRRRLRRAWPGTSVADMETAAAAAVAARAQIPWAALRTVTDRAGLGAGAAFRRNFESMAGLAADTLHRVLSRGSQTVD